MKKTTIYHGDCLEFLGTQEDNSIQLVITSPPYNVGKEYENPMPLEEYLAWQQQVIEECKRVLRPQGSIFWQVGNYVTNGEVVPLDILFYPIFADFGMKLRNRIVWHFRHGLHSTKRFSGRYEMILWFTKTDEYVYNLDDVRVPQLYPKKKHYKGPKKGQVSSNPLGKNPSDVWELVWDIPNVKHNHPEKTAHPCQFPEKMIERIVRAASNEGDIVFDPFLGSGTTVVVAYRLNRVGIGCEIVPHYVAIAEDRLRKEIEIARVENALPQKEYQLQLESLISS